MLCNESRIGLRSAVLIGSFWMFGGMSQAGEPLLIGRTLPLTGPLATYGKEKMAGADLAIDAENAKGGVGGRPIKVVTLDDRYDPEVAAENVKTLKDQQVLMLINVLGVGPVNRLLPIVEKLKLPTVGLSSGASEVREPFRRYVFPVRSDYNEEARFTVRQLETLSISTVVLLEQDDSFGKSVADAYRSALQQSNKVTLLKSVKVKRGGPVNQAIKETISASPQSVLIATIADPAAEFVKAYRAAGGTGLTYAMSVTNASQLAQMAPEISRGMAFSQVVPLPTSLNKKIVRDYSDLSRKRNIEVTYYGLEGFIEAQVALEALRRASKPATSEGIVGALTSMSAFDLGDYEVNYSSSSRAGSRYVEMIMIGRNGRLTR